MLDPTIKSYPMSKGKGEPQQVGRGAKLHLESNPIPTRGAWRAQTIPSALQEAPERLKQTCLLWVSCRGTDEQWPAAGAGALDRADLSVAKALLEDVTINPTVEPPKLTEDWGNRLLKAQTKPCAHQDPGERSSDPLKTDPALPMNVQESLAEAWINGGLLQGQGY